MNLKSFSHLWYRVYDSVMDFVVPRWFNPYRINPQGNCPVQAEGTLVGSEFYYFRARGCHWSLDIAQCEAMWFLAPNKGLMFTYGEGYGERFEAGFMPRWQAIRFATKAIKRYYLKKCKSKT